MSEKQSLVKEALRIAWPAVLESFFVSLASMIDTYMVSGLGTYAVAAVGLTTQPKFLALALFFSTNIAVSALVARRRGQNDKRNANEILLTALLFTIISCAIISFVTVVGGDLIIDWWLQQGYPCSSRGIFPHHSGRYDFLCTFSCHQRSTKRKRQHKNCHDYQCCLFHCQYYL